jgi:DNA-binding transcriptional LysR family regulator
VSSMKNVFHFQDAKIICMAKELSSSDAIISLLGIGEASFNVYTKRIEARLGKDIFVRNKKDKSLELTPDGLEIYPICKNIMEMMGTLDPAKPIAPRDIRGEVKLTGTQTLLEYFHLPYLINFVKEHPKLTVSLNQLDDLYPIVQSSNEFYFTVDLHEDTDTFTYFPYHDFVQKLWASEKYIEEYGKLEKFEDIHRHNLLFQRGYVTAKMMSGNKIKNSIPLKAEAGRCFNISGCRIVDRLCELGLGVMHGSEETVRLAGLKVQRVLPDYESDAVKVYVKASKSILTKDIGKIFLDWMFFCRDKTLDSLGIKPTCPYTRLKGDL